jgi:hypothetical protein
VLEGDESQLRDGAALVLQDVGHVDELVWDAGQPDMHQLERIFAAGGRRLREAAAERARSGLRLGHGDPWLGTAS